MRFILVLFLVCLQAMLPAGEKKGKICVFIAGEAFTTDMQQSIRADAEKMQKAFKVISKKTKMRLSMTVAQGTEFTAEKTLRWFKSIKTNKDIAVFYYSGKGANGQKSKWPRIFMYDKNKLLHVPVKKLSNLMKERVFPKFALFLFDCYEQCLFPASMPLIRKKDTESLSGLKNLFGKSRGMIVASSGPEVEKCFFSVGKPSTGGLFTSSFLKGLSEAASSKKAHWVRVMDDSSKLSKKAGQHPVVEYYAAVPQKQ
jgi:hypothetical protein